MQVIRIVKVTVSEFWSFTVEIFHNMEIDLVWHLHIPYFAQSFKIIDNAGFYAGFKSCLKEFFSFYSIKIQFNCSEGFCRKFLRENYLILLS